MNPSPAQTVSSINYAYALENISDAFIALDSLGIVKAYNQHALRLPLEGAALATGIPFISLFSDRYADRFTEDLGEAIKGNKRIREFEYEKPGSSRYYFELNICPVRVSVKDPVSELLVFIRDITQNKVIERRALATTSEMMNIIEDAQAIIFGVDSFGYVTVWNKCCEDSLGYKKEEVFARKIEDFLIPEEEIEAFKMLFQSALDGSAITNAELKIQRADGEIRTVLSSATPKRSIPGKVVGINFVGQDITEINEYKDSLEKKVQERTSELMESLAKEKELVNLKSRFISIASHEFRSPLSNILFSAGYLEKYGNSVSKEDVLKRIDSIKKSVQHMSILLDDVLTLGKSESGKIKVHSQDINFTTFINGILEEVKAADNNKHPLEVSGKYEGAIVRSDEKLLRNILTNLLGNALKYTPDIKPVQFKIRIEPRNLTFSIRDQGIGIAAEELETIFEPFQRASNSENFRGTGLGLSIVKKAVELLDGKIEVKSKPGKGSTFTVKLPAMALV